MYWVNHSNSSNSLIVILFAGSSSNNFNKQSTLPSPLLVNNFSGRREKRERGYYLKYPLEFDSKDPSPTMSHRQTRKTLHCSELARPMVYLWRRSLGLQGIRKGRKRERERELLLPTNRAKRRTPEDQTSIGSAEYGAGCANSGAARKIFANEIPNETKKSQVHKFLQEDRGRRVNRTVWRWTTTIFK